MSLSWNDIKSRILAFTQEWKDEVSKEAEAKSLWDDFFNVFGISGRRVETFEQQVRLIPNPYPQEERIKACVNPSPRGEGRGEAKGEIDLFWKGVILIEHKSRGQVP